MFVDNRVDQIPRKQIFFFSNLRDTIRDTNCSVYLLRDFFNKRKFCLYYLVTLSPSFLFTTVKNFLCSWFLFLFQV